MYKGIVILCCNTSKGTSEFCTVYYVQFINVSTKMQGSYGRHYTFFASPNRKCFHNPYSPSADYEAIISITRHQPGVICTINVFKTDIIKTFLMELKFYIIHTYVIICLQKLSYQASATSGHSIMQQPVPVSENPYSLFDQCQ